MAWYESLVIAEFNSFKSAVKTAGSPPLVMFASALIRVFLVLCWYAGENVVLSGVNRRHFFFGFKDIDGGG